MPSKSVSFSEDGYLKLMEEKPDGMGFSEWIERLSVEALEDRQSNGSEHTPESN